MQAIARMQHRAMVPRRPKRFVHPQSTANKRIYASRQYVKKVVKGLSETKHDETVTTNELVAQDSPLLEILSNVPLGDADTDREGDMIDPVSLEIRYAIRPTDATFAATVRVIVFQWQVDDTDNPPAVGDILAINTQLGAVNSPHVASGSRKNFRILYDRRHAMTTSNAAHIEPQLGFVRITAKRLARVYFDGIATKKGQLYLLATSNQLAADDEPVLNAVTQLKFKDL